MRNVRIAPGQMRAAGGHAGQHEEDGGDGGLSSGRRGRYHLFSGVIVYRVFCEKRQAFGNRREGGRGIVRGICEAAKKNGICIVAGFAERGDSNDIYNTAFFADRQGKIAGKARKVYLWKSEKRDLSRERNFLFLRRNLAGRPF